MPVQPQRPSDSAVSPEVGPELRLVPSPEIAGRRAGPEESWIERIGYLFINLGQALFLIVWSVFWITAAIVGTLVTLDRNVALVMARRFWGPGLIWISGGRFELAPLPKVDWSRPHIFVMNHQSMIDIPLAFTAIPVNIRFVAKHVLKYVPFLGWYMWMTGMVFVNRSNRAQAVGSLRQAGERIRAGANILAYPEGTRTRDGRLLPFKKGVFVLAIEAKVPIVPIAVEGSYDVLPSDGFRVRPRTMRMKLGEPIETAHLTEADRDALMAKVHAAMSALHREVGGAGAAE
jgi:1-acyl-sn-glycerol-3-phosphate acyltransferase